MTVVSVVITTHNRHELLAEALASVLAQEFADFEVVVVDDSDDEVRTRNREICRDPRIRHIENTSDRGSAPGLNIGVRSALGTYVAILDDDDVWIDAQKLQRQVDLFESDPEVVLVGTNGRFVDYDDTDRIMGTTDFPAEDQGVRDRLLTDNPIIHSSVMYSKDAWQQVGGYDANLKRGKDLELWLKLGLVGELRIVPEQCVMYRVQTTRQQNLYDLKYRDTLAKLDLFKRFRDRYPSSWWFPMSEYFRLLVFYLLK